MATKPSSMDSSAIVALSVSMSAITSPALTLAPASTFHSAMFPWVIVGESAGIVISWWGGSEANEQGEGVGGGEKVSTTRVGAFGRADGAENISKRRASRRRSRERTPPARGRGEGGEKTGKSSRARGETHNRRRRRKIARRAPSLARSSREAPASGRRTTDPTRSTPRSRRRRRSSRLSRAPPRRPSKGRPPPRA